MSLLPLESDKAILAAILAALTEAMHEAELDFVVKLGRVQVTGQVGSMQERRRAIEIVRGTAGVVEVKATLRVLRSPEMEERR